MFPEEHPADKAMRILQRIFMVVALICIVVFIVISVHVWFSTPVAYFSSTTGRCVEVIIKGEKCPCSELPEKYERIYVR